MRAIFSKLRISHKGLLLVAVPLIFQIAFVSVLALLLENAERMAAREARARAIVSEADSLNRSLFDSGMSLVAYNYMRSEAFLRRFDDSIARMEAGLKHLQELTASNLEQSQQAKQLEVHGRNVLRVLAKHRTNMTGESRVYAVNFAQFREDLAASFQPFMQELQAVVREEKKVQQSAPEAEAFRSNRIKLYLAAAVPLNIALALFLAMYFSKSVTKRLSILSENANRLAKHQELIKPVGGSDEVAELDRVFHEMADALRRAEEQKNEFVSMMSHDLRTPLTAIQGTFELLAVGAYGDLSEKGQKRVAEAERDTDRLISMINDLLDIERLEAGMLKIEKQTVPLGPVLKRALSSVSVIAEQRGVMLSQQETNLQVLADEDRIVQITINILGNALKYSPAGTTVSLDVCDKNGYAEVGIKDEGPGIPAAYIDKIFDRFQQVDDDGTKKKGTSGLGLAICKALVEAHGGQIGVQSKEGQGTRFWYRIPLA